MKTFLLLLVLSIHAFGNHLYRDEEIDLVIQVPDNLIQTWNISNNQNGLSITVFNTDDENDEAHVLVVAKFPMQEIYEDEVVDILPLLFEQFYQDFSNNESSYLLEEVSCHIEKLMPLSPEFSDRYRVHFCIQEVEEVIRMDLHLFVRNGQSCALVTGGLESIISDNLDDFSEEVIQNTRFIEGV